MNGTWTSTEDMTIVCWPVFLLEQNQLQCGGILADVGADLVGK
jgi:hypothetical protein